MNQKCGYIALVGAPNAGKSTLLNALLRKKISIVSNKPQTTRNKILGIVTCNESQLLFLDTPGVYDVSSRGSALSSRGLTAGSSIPWEACQDADIICYLIDSTRGWKSSDTKCLQKISELKNKKVVVLGTKIDKLKKQEVAKVAGEFNKMLDPAIESRDDSAKPRGDRDDTFQMISSKRPDDVQALSSFFAQNLPNSEWLYDKDSVTDVPENFVCAEFIREQLFRQLGEELPYQTSVSIDKLEKFEQIVHIYATISVMRDSQKAIIIGQGGSRLKTIGQFARESLEKYLGKKIFLKIFVKKGDV